MNDEHDHRPVNVNADVHLHLHGAGDLEEIKALLKQILANQRKMMATLDQVLVDVTEEGTQIDSLSVLTAGLKQQLADALAGVNLPPAVQAKVDAVFAGVEANKQKVVDAINANTPAATA